MGCMVYFIYSTELRQARCTVDWNPADHTGLEGRISENKQNASDDCVSKTSGNTISIAVS
jgi:hypothetical protein